MTATERAMANIRKQEESQKKLQAEAKQREIERRAAAMEHHMKNLRTDIQVGMIAEDCALHIGEVIECDPIEGNVRIRSMFDGVERGCDLYRCGVVAQTSEEIATKMALYKEGGMPALVKYYESQFPEFY